MMWRAKTLRSRVVMAFAGFTVAVAAVLGFSTTVLLYSVEDEFFNSVLAEEAAQLERRQSRDGQWVAPQQAWMSVHSTPATMPSDLSRQIVAEPRQREFSGDAGRHYHVRQLSGAPSGGATATAWLVAEVSSRLIVRPMRTALVRQWLIVELMILLLALAIALGVARRITRPLSELADTVRHLQPEAPSLPIALSGADREVAMVAHALNEMRARVDAFVAREQAFTRDTSHELRTPLSVIQSTVSQALTDGSLSPAARRLLTLGLQSAAHMERAVASLLAMTREGAVAVSLLPCAILPILEAVVMEQSAALDARGLTLRIEMPRLAVLHVSDVVLHLVLSNLLGNAVAHAAHGPITVVFENARLTFSNPVEAALVPDAETLGMPGVKGDASRGTGFGLSILKRLCERAGLTVAWGVRGDTFEVVVGDVVPRGAD